MALSISAQALLVGDGLGRLAHSATAAIGAFASAGDGIVTDGAFKTISAFLPCGLAAVGDSVAGSAQRKSVGDRVSEMRMGGHFFNVMCLQGGYSTAMLAGVAVALENLATPTLVFPRAMVWRGAMFARGGISALFVAIFGGVSIALFERFTTALTCQLGRLPGLASALWARCAPITSLVQKGLTANGADMCSASVAESLTGRAYDENFPALSALALLGEYLHSVASLQNSIAYARRTVKRLVGMGLEPQRVTQ